MNKLHVKSLNEYFNVDGPDWIIDDPNSHTPFITPPPWNKGKKVGCSEEIKSLLRNYNKGRKQTKSHRENISKSMKGNEKSINSKKKHYKITFINGEEVYVFGMVEWCKNNHYSFQSLYRFIRGERKKYKDIMAVEELAQDP
jgi:hypothetical protein